MYFAIVVGNISSLAGTEIELWKNTDKHRAKRYGKSALARRTDAALEVFVGTACLCLALREPCHKDRPKPNRSEYRMFYQLSPGNGLIRIR